MTITEIYQEFTPGSPGFVKAIQTHSGMEISNEEIEKLAERCKTAEDFENAWKNEDWWRFAYPNSSHAPANTNPNRNR